MVTFISTVAAEHDTLEQIWGWSQVGGALLALAAVALAGVSAWQARGAAVWADRSAKAAELTAKSTSDVAATAREELELVKAQANRRPILRLTVDTIEAGSYDHFLETLDPTDVHPLQWAENSVGLQLGLSDEGDADAEDTVINLIVPPRCRIWKWLNAMGEGEESMVTHRTGQEFPAFDHAIYAVDFVEVRRNIASVKFFRVEFPDAGTFPIRISASHPDSTVSVSRSVEVS